MKKWLRAGFFEKNYVKITLYILEVVTRGKRVVNTQGLQFKEPKFED